MEKNKIPERPRRFMIVINNPIEHGFTHERIKKILNRMPSVIFFIIIPLKMYSFHPESALPETS